MRPVNLHLKTEKVDFKKRPQGKKKFLHIFSIHSSSRHEKLCQMLQRLFWLFQCSKNPRWTSYKPISSLIKLQLKIYLKESSEKLIEITHRVAENMELLVLWLLLMEMTLLCCRSSFSFPMTWDKLLFRFSSSVTSLSAPSGPFIYYVSTFLGFLDPLPPTSAYVIYEWYLPLRLLALAQLDIRPKSH